MARNFNLAQTEQHFKRVLQYAPFLLGNMAVNFFLDRFRYQNWLGETTEPWKPRKKVTKWGRKNDSGRSLLIQTGRLRRSIRITSVHFNKVTIGSDVPYARAHNEGVRLGLIMQIREHERKLTKLGIVARKQLKTKSNITFGRVETGTTTVQAHKRRVNQNIPRRQFMGNSPVLEKQLQRKLLAELLKGQR